MTEIKKTKVYHVETQADYDALMVELEGKGCEWKGGEKPTNYHMFKKYGKDTRIYDEYGVILLSSGNYFKEHHSDELVIEYKAKGEKMTQEENMTQDIIDRAKDASVAVESAIKDIKFQMKKSTVEADLQEAKSSAKKLIEKIDEYLETLKPEFEVGDYVTVYVNSKRKTAKIDELTGYNSKAHGLWYDQTLVNVEQDFWFISKVSKCRYATSEEIVEYEVALTFHKRGRNPFELKRGDVVYLKGYDKNIFLDSGNIYKKHNFINGDVVLVKTAEKVNEWLENK